MRGWPTLGVGNGMGGVGQGMVEGELQETECKYSLEKISTFVQCSAIYDYIHLQGTPSLIDPCSN